MDEILLFSGTVKQTDEVNLGVHILDSINFFLRGFSLMSKRQIQFSEKDENAFQTNLVQISEFSNKNISLKQE